MILCGECEAFRLAVQIAEPPRIKERSTGMGVLVLRSDRRFGPLGGYRFLDTLQIGVDQR
jgi:hypothetical protein